MKYGAAATGLAVTVLAAAAANAHHSAAAAFTTNLIEVEGTVTEFNFTNPHITIFFDVTGDAGETTRWTAEGSAANLMRRRGWTADTIRPGQYLRIAGREARNEVPMVLLGSIVELDPDDGSPVRNVEGESDYNEPVGAAPLALTLDDGRPNFTGAWTMGPGMGGGGPPGDRTPPPYNPAGVAAAAEFDPVSDPAVACEPPGLVRQAGFTPHPVRLTQLEDRVILEYEEYGGRREVPLAGVAAAPGAAADGTVAAAANGSAAAPGDDAAAPAGDAADGGGAENTHLGRSVGRYEGGTLVIETDRLLENYTSPNGNPVSGRTTTVEIYRRMDDPDIGAALALEMVITDPAYLAGPWTLRWLKYYTPGYEFIGVDCRVPPTYRPAAE